MKGAGRVFQSFGLVAILAASTAGCAGPGAASPAPTPTPAPQLTATALVSMAPPALAIPQVLQGLWTASVSGTTATSGAWKLNVTTTDMLLQNPIGEDEFSINPIAATDSTLTLAADPGCPDQATVSQGKYTYVLSAGKLTISAIDDTCGDRRGVLTDTSWTK